MNELSKVSSISDSIDASKVLRNDHHNYPNQVDLNTSLSNPIMNMEKVRSTNINHPNFTPHKSQHYFENQHRNIK
jgi:hypothetical protein